MKHYVDNTDALSILIKDIEKSFGTESPEYAAFQKVLADPTIFRQESVNIACLLLGDNWANAQEKVLSLKRMSDNGAASALRKALNDSPILKTEAFQSLLTDRGYALLQPENKWYIPRKEFALNSEKNKFDKFNVAGAIQSISPEYMPIFDAAYKGYLRGNSRIIEQNTRLSYNQFSYVVSLLLPEDKQPDFMKILLNDRNYPYSESKHDKDLISAHDFIAAFCAGAEMSSPSYNLADHLVRYDTTPAPLPVKKAPAKKTGPSLPQVSFLQTKSDKTDQEDLTNRRALTKAYLSAQRNSAKADKELVGRDGFDLPGALAFIKSARTEGDLTVTDKIVEVFKFVAADNGKTQKDIEKELGVKPLVAGIMYKKFSKELKEAEIIPPAFQ